MENQVQGKELNWDDEITTDGEEFIVLPAGEYPFVVLSVERGRTSGEGKLPPCNMVIVNLEIDGGTLGKTIVKDRFVLHSTLEWRLSNFYTAIGMKKKDETTKMNWPAVPTKTGKCKLGIKTYNDNQYNEVKGYIAAETFQQTW